MIITILKSKKNKQKVTKINKKYKNRNKLLDIIFKHLMALIYTVTKDAILQVMLKK